MANNVEWECPACGRRVLIAIRAEREDALADLRQRRNVWRACAACGHESMFVAVRDAHGRLVATTDMFDAAYVAPKLARR